MFFSVFTFNHLLIKDSHLDSLHFVWFGLIAIALSLGLIGWRNLTFGGYKRIARIFLSCFLSLLILGFVLIFTRSEWVYVYTLAFIASSIWIILFPLSLYLNRSPKKQSVAQIMIDNAN